MICGKGVNAKFPKLPLFAICASSDISVSCEINHLILSWEQAKFLDLDLQHKSSKGGLSWRGMVLTIRDTWRNL